jgi:hypothetical protein
MSKIVSISAGSSSCQWRSIEVDERSLRDTSSGRLKAAFEWIHDRCQAGGAAAQNHSVASRRIVGVMTTARRVRRGAGVLLATALLSVLLPGSTLAARSHTVDLGARADFVAQSNFVQCVGASMQMMLNIIEPGRDRTARTQRRLQELARSWSGSRPDGRQRQGASVRGWAAGLNILGAGPYKLVGEDDLDTALRTAARAIAETGKPVGLLVWRGRHAWVMTGFKATADPLATDDFEVTRAMVMDPLYPYGSSVWGPSPKPGQAVTPTVLGRQFVPRRMGAWSSGQPPGVISQLGGKYVLVLPYRSDLAERAALTR